MYDMLMPVAWYRSDVPQIADINIGVEYIKEKRHLSHGER